MTFTAILAILTIIGIANDVGIGPGRVVTVRYDDAIAAVAITDQNSQATVTVGYGIHDVEIDMPRSNPFYIWVCRDQFVPVDTPHEVVSIRCMRRWALALPFLRGA